MQHAGHLLDGSLSEGEGAWSQTADEEWETGKLPESTPHLERVAGEPAQDTIV